MDPKRMIDGGLSQTELDVLRAADGDRMSAKSRSAILGALGVALPPVIPGADVSSLTGASQATGTGAAGALGAVGKGLLGILGVGIVGGASFWGYVQLTQQPPTKAHADTSALSVNEVPAEIEQLPVSTPLDSAAPTEANIVKIAPAEAELPKSEPNGARRSTSTPESDSLPREFALIEAAQAALKQRDGRTTLRRLEEYRGQFPQGQLRAEARMLRIEALAATGQRTEAIRLGESTLKASPAGPYSGRLRSLLDELGAKSETSP